MDNHKIKAIVWDVDNTLYDFWRMKRVCIVGAVEAMIDEGFQGEVDDIVYKIYSMYWKHGIEDQHVFEKFLQHELGSINYRLLGAAVSEYRKRKINAMITYPRTYQTLTLLIKRGIKLGVLSDAPRVPLYTRLATLKLSNYFDVIVTADDAGGLHKPHPKIFKKVCSELHEKPKNVLMVGDWNERDVEGAKSVGMQTAFAKYGDYFHEKHPSADYVLLKGPDEVLNIIGDEDNVK